MQAGISREELLQELKSIRANTKKDNFADIAFQDAASVLIRFEPKALKPFNFRNSGDDRIWSNYFSCCEPVKHIEGNWWQLRPDIRRQALRRLRTQENMLLALQANPDRPQDAAQKLFDRVLQEGYIDISGMRREELVMFSGILEWLKDILPVSENFGDIQRAIPLADLLAPMRRLAGADFVGRKKELADLSDYVGIKPETGLLKTAGRFILRLFGDLSVTPPLLIYGPGGVGKSTLLGKFILENADAPAGAALPFAYLDIDRAVFDLQRPETLVIEAARQLAIQIPEKGAQFSRLKENTEEVSEGLESIEYSKSFFSAEEVARQFGEIVSAVGKPVFLVIDTFEEVQYLGTRVVDIIWSLLVALQKAAPNLRSVVAGRAMVDFPVKEVRLPALSREEAQQLIRSSLSGLMPDEKAFEKTIDEIIDKVGLNPLSLRLATTLIKEQGIAQLREVETRRLYLFKLKEEVIQARLYGRILAHVHGDLQKLVFPGLILRRINAEVILEVLSPVCGLKLNDEEAADELMADFSKEVSLMEPDDAPGSLRHRPDVRRIMLEDLKNEVSETVIKKIHEAAIDYYQNKAPQNDVSRAEEIYHRLSLGENPKVLNKLWHPGLEQYLRSALEELNEAGKLWLSTKLGVTPDEQLRKSADLEDWEDITGRDVQRFLQSGNAGQALAALGERKERSPGSRLYRLELEALRMTGQYAEAGRLADKALAATNAATSKAVVRDLLMQAAFIQEALGNVTQALTYVLTAGSMAAQTQEPVEALKVIVAHIRLLRKAGSAKDTQRATQIDLVKDIVSDSAVLESLRDYPALVRELVAEVGKIIPDLLRKAIGWFGLGIDAGNTGQTGALSNVLVNWNEELSKEAGAGQGELVERAGIAANSTGDWMTYIQQNAGRQLSHTVQHWLSEITGDEASNQAKNSVGNVIVDIFRDNVDASINKNG